ncbi:OadG family protein [Pseudobutyrivibrio sp.]|uniref:OadG family protein n=1 Tax=Pseudobutyrivibrio sp. TaxID=2014367 RepID=UPI001D70D224|nr:OadG family protein [Pseudobutyrivibrio sp.]MBE5909721.1 hypothetical protein [Pseudobutyrivibrio sp.]
MKKKLLVCICTFAMALGITACGSSEDDGTIGGLTIEEYESDLTTMMSKLGTLNEELIDYNIANVSQYEGGEVIVGLLEDYKECYDAENTLNGFYDEDTVIGGFNIGSLNVGGTKAFSVTKSGKTITATLIADFTKRDLKLTYVYNINNMDQGPTAINVEGVYSLGETMKKAGLNTVMGIVIVFVMLIVMSGVIKCFEIIPKLEKKAKEKKEAGDTSPVVTPVQTVATQQTDDLQLVAVIAAAIAASTGASTDSFVVRSIKKR